MIFFDRYNRAPHRVHLIGLTVLVVIVTLLCGIWPKGRPSTNNINWLSEKDGLEFFSPSIAYVNDLRIPKSGEKMDSFTVHLVFVPSDVKKSGFRPIFSIHDGEDHTQLSLWQWGASIFVMNGDDYDYSKKKPRLSAHGLLEPNEEIVVSVISSDSGSYVYANGKLVAEKNNLQLVLPASGSESRLVLGNSVYADDSWHGRMYCFAFALEATSRKIVEQFYNNWKINRFVGLDLVDNPLIVFSFSGGKKSGRCNEGDCSNPLILPDKMISLEKEVLALPVKSFRLSGWFWFDFVINILGFAPAGAMAGLFLYSCGLTVKKSMLFAVIACFVLSLTIELSQVWLVHRHSSLLDLILNTIGGGFGATLVFKFTGSRLQAKQ